MAFPQQVVIRSLANDKKCLVISPDGREIEAPRELFAVLNDFMVTRKNVGSIIVHFRSGGVARLEPLVKKKYK